MIATVFFVLVRVSLTQDVNLCISYSVQYTFVNDHRVQQIILSWVKLSWANICQSIVG